MRGRPAGKPGYDYESDEFYESVEKMASAGLTDKEIAQALKLDPAHFSKLKNGKVSGSSDEVNARRSERIRKALNAGRIKITSLLHATYLNAALGKIYTKQKVRKSQEMPCACGGKDPNCPDCGGTGRILTDMGVISETEIQQPPNLGAVMNLLNVYDPDWRGGVAEEGGEADNGIDICRWIEQEAKARDKGAKEATGDDTDA